jgi:hypothetical protein
MYRWKRHVPRIAVAVVASGAAVALLEGLLVARSTLERRQAGGAPVAPTAPAAGERERCRGADEPAEQERTQASRLGRLVHGSTIRWRCQD